MGGATGPGLSAGPKARGQQRRRQVHLKKRPPQELGAAQAQQAARTLQEPCQMVGPPSPHWP